MFMLKQFLKGIILPPGIWLVLLLAVLIFWKRRRARKLLLAAFNVKTVRDLAQLKYVKWAQAIVTLADTEV